MKKLLMNLCIVALALVCILALPTKAQAASERDLIFELNEDGLSYWVSDCPTCPEGDLVIPATHNGKPVTAIGNRAFAYCSSLKSITIPDSVTSIGGSAFFGCTSLTSVTIGNSVTTIGESAFYMCDSLQSITIPDSVATIGRSAFSYCDNLTNVTIGKGVTTIGSSAFPGCNHLTDVYITDVTAWWKISFSNSYYANPMSCADNLHILDSAGNEVTDLVLDSSVTQIPDSAFKKCNSLKSVTIPDGVTSISKYAFSGCTSLTSITIPDSVTSIGEDAFSDCDSLTSITIPDSVTDIGDDAFYSCSNLTSITIPDSVTSIGEGAFSYCWRLSAVYYTGTKSQWKKITVGEENGELISATLYCKAPDNIKSLSVTNLPGKVSYITGETLDLNGLKMRAVLQDGLEMEQFSCHADKISAVDMSTPGKKTVTVTVNGCATSFTITVHKPRTMVLPEENYPQSAHPYKYNSNEVKSFSYNDAIELTITFSAESCTEEEVDYIEVYNDAGYYKKLTGNFGGQVLTIPSGSFSIRLVSDDDMNCYGYRISSISAKALTHSYSAATCTKAKTCTICGMTSGNALGHSYAAATCTKAKTCTRCKVTSGKALGHKYTNACDATCNTCGAKRSIKHTYKTTTTKATLTKNGSVVKKCTVCGKVASKTTIKKISTVKLYKTSYTYTGNVRVPTVIVKDSAGKTLKKDVDYTVSYSSGRKNVGTYKVTVKFKGNYSGTKVLTFKITPAKSTTCTTKLSKTTYTYNGKAQKPSVVVKDSAGKTLKNGTDYTVTYQSGRKNVGTYKVTIKFKGNYSGTKTLTFKVVPRAASVNKLTAKSKALQVKLNRSLKQSTGYEIQYSTNKTFKGAEKKVVKNYKTSLVTLSGLKAKTTYYVRVRTYKTVGGTKYYSGWSTYKSAKTK